MQKIIGIRTTPSIIYYSIIEIVDSGFNLINQQLIIPKSFDIPEKLKYIRKTLFDIFNEYQIEYAGIRITEHSAFAAPDTNRVMIEGVIQEMIASSSVISYFTGVKSSIGKRLNIPNNGSISEIMDGGVLFNNITDWQQLKSEHRESIMVAFAALNNN